MERKVTTYPLPSNKYQELVCTAGITEDGDWIRIYPIPLSNLINSRFLDLEKRSPYKDFRPESFNPVKSNLSDMTILSRIDTHWEERKKYCLKNVYFDLKKLIDDSKNKSKNVSLATFKPSKIKKFHVIDDDKDWKPEWKEKMKQLCIFTNDPEFERLNIKKVPFKFKYTIEDENGKESTMMIEDWEIGQLYWNCLKEYGTPEKAKEKVREMYWETIAKKRDTYLFLGTNLKWLKGKKDQWVFYPTKDPNENQMSLF